jgi:hypothetical protein
MLTHEGSLRTHQLLLTCFQSSAAVGTSQHIRLPSEGLWNGMTTTSANDISPETLGHLVMLHVQCHARLGLNGTILCCNKGRCRSCHCRRIEALMTAKKLIIWPESKLGTMH